METACPFPPIRHTWRALLALAVSAGLHCTANGQSAPSVNESLLNVSESELQVRLPDLRRTAKPIPGPRGLRGQWVMSETTPQGLVLDTIVYVRSGNVQRIEQRWASRAPGDCQPQRLGALAAPIERRFGPAALASDDAMDADTQQHTTLWNSEEAQARLVLTRTGERCSALIVYAPLVTPDASEL